ncbi:MAG: acyl-CoA dehydrogenase [Actinomycetia bacterium]|nr:acyl-CoA dehydrogenase [Actinomycetes bacterium]
MSIAITDDHRMLAETASDLLRSRDARGAARELLEAPGETLPALWKDVAELGWLGLHIPEDFGGSGFGLEELVVVTEEMGRAVAPGPFSPTVIASALVDAVGDDDTRRKLLPGLVDGSTCAAIAVDAAVTVDGGKATGSADAVLGGGLAQLLVVPAGDDALLVEVGDGVKVTVPANLDPTRRSARVELDSVPTTVLAGARQVFIDLARTVLSAEAVGVARECTDLAAEYAKVREQFGRPIAMFQAVKHHLANMAVATELATGAVWDAARAGAGGGAQLTYAGAVAASLSAPAADLCANLNTQVHGGIAMTWESDAHLYMRRAAALKPYLLANEAAAQITDLVRDGVARPKAVDLPPEAEEIRTEVQEFIKQIEGASEQERLDALLETGYVMPHWPRPHGRDAGAIEQLVIEEEFKKASVERPKLGITAWNILTIIQYGEPDQLERWVDPAMRGEVIWCQLFSEPDAGSDAAAVKTKATRVDGGWLVNGQKVWTSDAHEAGMGFATVRTNPDLPKHEGITMMAIDMHADGVEVRPLKMTNAMSMFNEVFFSDVFVPDDDVVGPIDGGWTVARATLGNESVSIGSGDAALQMPGSAFLPVFDAHPERLFGGAARLGRYLAEEQAMGLLNLRVAHRAVEGAGPGPEGAVTKLVLSELAHEATSMLSALDGPELLYTDGENFMTAMFVLIHRAMSIAGGTSEIKRNQIGERILGLPRDPLVK